MENGEGCEIIASDTPLLADDHIIQLAANAEARVAAVNKIKGMALRVTNNNDWVDEQGRPYLVVSGGEKVARLFGISWQIDEPLVEPLDGGHYMYTYTGTFRIGGASITAQGMRASKDPFFSRAKNEDVPVEKIDRANVKQAAYTSCIGNGVTRLIGLRNLTWEELDKYGIKKTGQRVDYGIQAKQQTAEEHDISKRLGDMLLGLCDPPNNAVAASALLEKYSGFVGKDGKPVPGKKKPGDLTGKWLLSTYGKVKEEYKIANGLSDQDLENLWACKPPASATTPVEVGK